MPEDSKDQTDEKLAAVENDFDSTPAEDFSDSESEFSLANLSKAYSKVLHKSLGVPDESAELDPSENDSDSVDQADIDSLDDASDNAPAPIAEHSIVEAILFVGVNQGEKLTAKKIASTMRDVSPKEVKQIVADLNGRYEDEQAPYRIVTDEGSYKMILRDEFQSIRDNFYGEIKEAQLNQQAIEVLSIVAYQQPISKNEIEKARQRPSGGIINQLVERQLLAVDSESTGKNKAYRTTQRFLDLFGLKSVEDLPMAHEVEDIDEFFDGTMET